VITSRL